MYVFKSLRVEYFESNQKQIFKNSDVTLDNYSLIYVILIRIYHNMTEN